MYLRQYIGLSMCAFLAMSGHNIFVRPKLENKIGWNCIHWKKYQFYFWFKLELFKLVYWVWGAAYFLEILWRSRYFFGVKETFKYVIVTSAMEMTIPVDNMDIYRAETLFEKVNEMRADGHKPFRYYLRCI